MNSSRNLFALFIALLVVFVATVSLHAQTASTTPAQPTDLVSNIVTWGTTIVVPLLIAGVKKIMPSLPSFVLPLLAPLLGVVIALLATAAGSQSNVWLGAIFGALGVWLREAKDQLFPANNGGWPSTTPPTS